MTNFSNVFSVFSAYQRQTEIHQGQQEADPGALEFVLDLRSLGAETQVPARLRESHARRLEVRGQSWCEDGSGQPREGGQWPGVQDDSGGDTSSLGDGGSVILIRPDGGGQS